MNDRLFPARPILAISAAVFRWGRLLIIRAQAPLVDQLLREIGIEGGDIQRLVGGVSGAQAALPPGPRNQSGE